VGEGVHSDLVTICQDLPQNLRVRCHLGADHEEGGVDMVAAQHLEDLRSPDRVRSVVKGQRDRSPLDRGRAGLSGGTDDRAAAAHSCGNVS